MDTGKSRYRLPIPAASLDIKPTDLCRVAATLAVADGREEVSFWNVASGKALRTMP